MIAVLSLIQKAYKFARDTIHHLNDEVDPDAHRQQLALDAVRMLRGEGRRLMIDVIPNLDKYEQEYATEIPVSILFAVEARAGQYDQKYLFHCVDITSWKALNRDLISLGEKFGEACKRSHPDKEHPSSFLQKDYPTFIKPIMQKAAAEPNF